MADTATFPALLSCRAVRDNFLSDILPGEAIRIVETNGGSGEYFADDLSAITRYARANRAALVSCRIGADDAVAGNALVSAGFQLIETLVTSRRVISPAPAMPNTTSPARDEDAARCVEISRTAFWADRFHADPSIDDDDAGTIKAEWMVNSFAGRADRILVTRDDDGATGFVTCLLSGDTAVIDLIAVSDGARGLGLGKALVAGALAAYAGTAKFMTVGTQDKNTASQAVYRSLGFVPVGKAQTFHLTPE